MHQAKTQPGTSDAAPDMNPQRDRKKNPARAEAFAAYADEGEDEMLLPDSFDAETEKSL